MNSVVTNPKWYGSYSFRNIIIINTNNKITKKIICFKINIYLFKFIKEK